MAKAPNPSPTRRLVGQGVPYRLARRIAGLTRPEPPPAPPKAPEASPVPQQRQGWQDMATAPRDGTRILIRYGESFVVGFYDAIYAGYWCMSIAGTMLAIERMVAWRPIHPFPNDWPGQ